MIEKFFSKEPEIRWTKVMCPVCNEPTGPSSECYKIKTDVPKHQRSMSHPQLGILPVFSENCAFRQNNLWEADLNYPVSSDLLDVIDKVSGVDNVVATKAYTFQIAIGKLFDEKRVKKMVNVAYKEFIKKLQKIEGGLNGNEELKAKLVGIRLPNGVECLLTEENKDSLEIILADLEGTKGIFERKSSYE